MWPDRDVVAIWEPRNTVSVSKSRPIRVALTNDFELVIAGLTNVLAKFPDRVHVRDTAIRGGSVEAEVDVALFDTFAHAGHGFDEIGRLLRDPDVRRVAVYTWEFDPAMVQRALDIGVTGYLSKSLRGPDLVDALEAIAMGRQTVSVDPESDRHTPAERDWPGHREGLSEREAEILILIAEGLSNADIVDSLHISLNSVKTHVRNAYRKLGVETRAQAVRAVLDRGMIRPSIRS